MTSSADGTSDITQLRTRRILVATIDFRGILNHCVYSETSTRYWFSHFRNIRLFVFSDDVLFCIPPVVWGLKIDFGGIKNSLYIRSLYVLLCCKQHNTYISKLQLHVTVWACDILRPNFKNHRILTFCSEIRFHIRISRKVHHTWYMSQCYFNTKTCIRKVEAASLEIHNLHDIRMGR